ncbi:hypothetical protein JCM11491_003309 [Sporobolomyces phaffii]
MGNNASTPVSDATLDSTVAQARPRIKKSSLPSLPSSSLAVPPQPAAWRRASEPSILPRRKSFLRKTSRRRSDENRAPDELDAERPEVPKLVIGEGDACDRVSEDSYEGMMIRVAGRKFSRADPVDTEDALDALERITRAASFSAPSATETGLGLMTKGESKQGRATAVPFSFDVNYRLDSPRAATTFVPSPALQPYPAAHAQTDISPFDSPIPRLPLSPQSHWSDSSACGLTPPQTFQSFRNSVNLTKTINRYSNLFVSSGESTPSPPDSIIDSQNHRSPARTKLGGLWRGHRGKKSSGQGRELGDIVVVRAERVGSSRYSELRSAAGRATELRRSMASSSFPTSPDVGEMATRSASSSSSRLDHASWMQLDSARAQDRSPTSPSRRHSSPDPQLANFVAASPVLAFASPEDNIFVPFGTDSPQPANPAPVKTSTRLPSGHPAAYHLSRFSNHRQSPPTPTRRPRLVDSRTSSYNSGHRLSHYTAGSRQSVISEVDSTSSALQATVQQGYRTSRIGSVSVPRTESASSEVFQLPLPYQPSTEEPQVRETPRRVSISSAGWSARRPSQASALSFPYTDSPDCPRGTGGRHLSITSTFFGGSSSSPDASPPPVPLPRHDFDFKGYSLDSDNPSCRPSRTEVAPEVDPGETAPGSFRRSRPPSPELERARSSTPSSIPALTSATSASFSSRSSMDPCPSLQVPTRPHGRLSLEQPDSALTSLSKPLAVATAHPGTIDFGNFSLDPWNRQRPSRRSGSVPSRTVGLGPTSRDLGPSVVATDAGSKLDECSWTRASAGDVVSRTPRAPAGPSLGLDERRETYPGNGPSESGKHSGAFDPSLVHQQLERNYPERKRGLSKDEVRIWLGDRSVRA